MPSSVLDSGCAISRDRNHGQGSIGGLDFRTTDDRVRPQRIIAESFQRNVILYAKHPERLPSSSWKGIAMDTHRSQCGMSVPSHGKPCSNGETSVANDVHPIAHTHHRARGAFGGMLFGLIAAPILIIPGILLCLLGWGIVLGIPMILLGILLPVAGPLFGMGEHKGRCPSCGTRMISIEDGKKHECPVCSTKFAMEDQHAAGSSEHRESQPEVKRASK